MATIKKTPMRITPAMVSACGNTRKIPKGYFNPPLVETLTADGADYTYAFEPPKQSTADYVREFCDLNHLTRGA